MCGSGYTEFTFAPELHCSLVLCNISSTTEAPYLMWHIRLKICVYYLLLQVSERLKVKVFQWLLSLGQQTRLFCIIASRTHSGESSVEVYLFFIIWNIILKAFSHSLFWWYSEASCCTQVKHCEVQTLKLWPHWLLTFWSTAKDYWTIYMITWAVLAWKWTRWMETDSVHLETIRCKLPMVGALKKCSSWELFCSI